MIQSLLVICSALLGGLFVLLKKNKDLESDKKLNDIKIEDVKLEAEQENIQEEKKKLEKQLKNLEKSKEEDVDDIEKFWKDRK